MKKVLSLIAVATVAVVMAACHRSKPVEPTIVGYDYYDEVCGDYGYMLAQYDDFDFYEADVLYNIPFNEKGAHYITSIITVFQVGDTCIRFVHKEGAYGQAPDTLVDAGYWVDCMPCSPCVDVTPDEAVDIAIEEELPTRVMVFRRILAPPFPECGQYIFGKGLLFIDGCNTPVDGEFDYWEYTEGYLSDTLIVNEEENL